MIAPARAFVEITQVPQWLAAYVIIVLTGAIALAMQLPAVIHVVTANPTLLGDAGKSVAAIQDDVRGYVYVNVAEQVLSPLFTIGLTATVLTSVARYKGKDTSFRVYLSLASNCLMPTAIGMLLSGIAVAVHPAAAFADFRAVDVALPDNLAIFSAPNNPRETAFLAHFDVFTIWSTLLLGFGFAATTPVKFTTAISLAFGITLILAILN